MQLVVNRIGAGEFGELLVLVLPGGAEVAVEMRVFLQLRIGVAGQHLAVGVDVDALALGLLEQHSRSLRSWPEIRMHLPFCAPSGTGVGTGWP